MTPLDRAPREHDKEYSRIARKHGMNEETFFLDRFLSNKPSVYKGTIKADAALISRSWGYTFEGVAKGVIGDDAGYDLGFRGGLRSGYEGWRDVALDAVMAHVITGIFVHFMAIDTARLVIMTVGDIGEKIGAGITRSAQNVQDAGNRSLLGFKRAGDDISHGLAQVSALAASHTASTLKQIGNRIERGFKSVTAKDVKKDAANVIKKIDPRTWKLR